LLKLSRERERERRGKQEMIWISHLLHSPTTPLTILFLLSIVNFPQPLQGLSNFHFFSFRHFIKQFVFTLNSNSFHCIINLLMKFMYLDYFFRGKSVDSVAIEARNLNFSFTARQTKDVTVLRDCSIRIPSGQFWMLLGPNGCGKSTLLKVPLNPLY
jgi:ABC-type multidrug transport system fused ATPase/permease subunit